jgi:ribosome-binding protein aMBF1 (putative translation factor)
VDLNDEILQDRKALCRRIASAIHDKGWSQKQFAMKWGRPESQVSHLLSGKVDMHLSTITEIEKILGIQLINR